MSERTKAAPSSAELRDPDVVIAFDTTTEAMGIVIYETTAERASLEGTFVQLTTSANGDAR